MVARWSANPLGMLWPEMLRLPSLLERSGLVVLGTCPFCTFVLLMTPTCRALKLADSGSGAATHD
jgi:hypothetical protein